MSGSRIIIAEGERLPNVHPGEILRDEFLIGSEISIDGLCAAAGIASARLNAVLDGTAGIDTNLDMRLARYFGLPDGFFLGLQTDYDVEEFRRVHGAELDRIEPRAA